MRIVSLYAAALVHLAACAGPIEKPTSVVERVENGVRIIENTSLIADSTSWSFDSVPAVVIGVADGPPEYIIGRLGGYVRRPNGNVLVGDAIAQTIREYDSAGEYIRTFGGNGDGPGEYRVLQRIARHAGDSIFVVDYEGSRGTVLNPDLEFVRSFHIRLDSTAAIGVRSSDGVADISGDGHLLMYEYLDVCGSRQGFCEDSMALFRTDLNGRSIGSLGRFVYMRQQSHQVSPGRFVSWGEPHPQVFRRTMGSKTYYADAKRFEIQVYGPDGELEMVVEAPQLNTRYSREQLLPAAPARPGADSAQMTMIRVLTEAQKAASLPDTLPQFSAFLVDDLGNMWVGEFRPAGIKQLGWPRWYVFAPDGRLTNIVRSPPEFRIHNAPWLQSYPQIGDATGVTSRRDSDGVESVAMYRIHKR